MKKKSINCFFDNLLWYMLYMLPLFLLFVNWCKGGSLSLIETFNQSGLGLFTNNPILTTFGQIFGADGTIPLFASADVICYACYYVCVFLVHLLTDFLLFIPRFCHKMFDKFEKEVD